METPNSAGLAEALKQLISTVQAAAHVNVETLTVDDGRGGKLGVPVAMLPTTDGGMTAQSLLGAVEAGQLVATRLRLATADGPDRRTGVAKLQSLESFIAHANRFKAECSAVWADSKARLLVSVLDYHPAGPLTKPKWGTHRGQYPCPLSEAWLAWGGVDGRVLSQEAFSDLLDSRDQELAGGKLPNGTEAPTPAFLITLANNLEVYSTANAKRERDVNTGKVRVSFSEEKGIVGSVQPPPAFLVNIPIFQDGGPLPLEVRLRVVIDGGHAKFAVQIHAAGDILRTAFEGLCDKVASETALPVFVGVPE
jgi:hypothetical protein